MDRKGKVITFYSFKGGVGRTMALANAAGLLAQRGHKVLALDFDFEAPGLHRYFLTHEHTSFERYEPKTPREGVINLFHVLRASLNEKWPGGEGLVDPGARQTMAAMIGGILDSDDYRYAVRLKNPNAKGAPPASLQFMPAGRFDDTYANHVRTFDWQAFYQTYAEVFPILAVELSARYDRILIDSRTGVTDIGSVCTMLLPDKLVLAFSPNDQSLSGALEAGFQSVRERQISTDPRPLPVFPLLSRLEMNEESEKRHWVKKAQGRMELLFRKVYGLDTCDLEAYFQRVRIPHHSFYAYGEKIAIEEQAIQETGSLAQAYGEFVDALECAGAVEAQNALEMKAAEDGVVKEFLANPDGPDGFPGRLAEPLVAAELLAWLAHALSKRQHFGEALGVADEVVRRFSGSEDPKLRLVVVEAMLRKQALLGALKRPNEANLVCEQILQRFDRSEGPSFEAAIGTALSHVGFHTLLSAKQLWLAGKREDARAMLTTAEDKTREALTCVPSDPVTIGNAGYLAFLLGREDEARELLERAIQLGGEKQRRAELDDADIHVLPQDEAFRALVRSIPGPGHG